MRGRSFMDSFHYVAISGKDIFKTITIKNTTDITAVSKKSIWVYSGKKILNMLLLDKVY